MNNLSKVSAEHLKTVFDEWAKEYGSPCDYIESKVRQAIMDKKLLPEAWITQQALADVFKVSRMPVREALRILESQGYVAATRHKGYLVAAGLDRFKSNDLQSIIRLISDHYNSLETDEVRLGFESAVLDLVTKSAPTEWKDTGKARWYDEKLGELSDTELSKTIGVPIYIIRYRREQLGIKAYSSSKILEKYNNLIGKCSDRKIAEMSKQTPSAVGRYRRSKGVREFRPDSPYLNVPEQHPVKPVAILLGLIHDQDLANLVGLSVNAITDLRKSLLIPAPVIEIRLNKLSSRSLIYKYEHLIPNHEISDQLLANLAGISRQRVSSIRKKHAASASPQNAADNSD
jgi:DNA-binding transcriptional regulator YhcF (GntR family)